MINESNLQTTSQKLLLFRLDLELCHVWIWPIYDSTDLAFTHCLHLFRHKTSVQHFDLSFSIIWVYFWQQCRVLSMRIQQLLLSYLATSYWLKKRNEMESIFFNLLKSMVDLHSCVNLSCTAKQFSYMYTFFCTMRNNVIHGLSRDIDCSSLWYTVGTVWLFIHFIYNSLHLLTSNSQPVLPYLPIPLSNHKSVLYVCEPVSVL